MLRLNLLGQPTFFLNDSPLTDFGSRTAEALLLYLACEQRPFSRQQLAEFLWHERDPNQSAANLRAVLSLLRKRVGDYLIVTRQTVAFNSQLPFALDTDQFAHYASQESITDRQTAVALYRGPFLDGFFLRESRDFEEWSLLQREHWQRLALLLLRQLLTDLMAADQLPLALQYADQLLHIDPINEYAHRQKMGLLARTDQLQAALRQYEQARTLLQTELGVGPNIETSQLADRIRRASQTVRHNLPPATNPFVGRSQELAALKNRLLAPDVRLLTILGSGGVGKTRLALEALRQLAPTGYFLNGLRFVPLDTIDDPALIPDQIAATLGILFHGDAPRSQQLATAVADDELLLLLDNVEQLLDGPNGHSTSLFLADLLAAAPLLKIVLTSRRHIQLREEWLFDVTGLSLTTAVSQTPSEAVQLFLQAAKQIQRQFAPNQAEMAAIEHLCHTLEGLPLAIELAAAWLRQLSCQQIADKVDQSLELLVSSLRNLPARHRSMTAVFDYSWQLLPPVVQTVLAALALFRGGFTAVAAQAVADASLAHLSTLVEHSLLRWENGRYHMHELLRQYLMEQLAQLERATAVGQTHATFFQQLLAQQGDGESKTERQLIQTELANIRVAWEHMVKQANEAALLQMAEKLHNFYSVESRFYEGIALFQKGLHLLADASPLLQADLLGRTMRMQAQVGQVKAARQTLDKVLPLLPRLNDPLRQAAILGYGAITFFYSGEFGQTIQLAQESLALAEQNQHRKGIASAHNLMGSAYRALGDYAVAASHFSQAAVAYEQSDDPLGKAMAWNNLGNLAQSQGDFAAAQQYYLACSQIFREHDHLHGAATTLANAGQLAARQGDYGQARQLLSESLTLKRAQQDEGGIGLALVVLGEVLLAEGEVEAATAVLQEALQLAQHSGNVKLGLQAVAQMAQIKLKAGQTELAWQLFQFLLGYKATSLEMRQEVQAVLAQHTAVATPPAQISTAVIDLEMALRLALTA